MDKNPNTYFEVVISFRPFMGLVPQTVLKEKAEQCAKELHGEVREVSI